MTAIGALISAVENEDTTFENACNQVHNFTDYKLKQIDMYVSAELWRVLTSTAEGIITADDYTNIVRDGIDHANKVIIQTTERLNRTTL